MPYVRQPIEFPTRYAHGPDSFPQPGVPRGVLHEYKWDASRVFPATRRRYWVYVPAQYTDAEPAALMVFQDAEWYLDPDFEARAPIVFDNLIHRGEMPVTIGVFVAPGEPGNRKVEYDAFSDAYATFLLTEILPDVRNRCAITDDPNHWAIGGGSSGGSCAFTVGWMRPRPLSARSQLRRKLRAARRRKSLPRADPADADEASACLPPHRDPRPQLGRSSEQLVQRKPTGRCRAR
jgi:hypothetical protein